METLTRTPAFDGQRLRALRQQHGWSAERLARRADLSTRHVWRLERNHRPQVAAVTVARLALALETTLEFLLGLTDDPQPYTPCALPECPSP
ncbi:MAG: helix-turn-helix transcriptional regulator [Anaerolineae bacterium]|nr:helix-turn-helix transcriptional regulator [Anaerolineae bacterium]